MICSLSVVESLWFFCSVCVPSYPPQLPFPTLFISPRFLRGSFLLTPHSSLQNGFLVRLFVLMKWNAAKSLRAFFSWKKKLKAITYELTWWRWSSPHTSHTQLMVALMTMFPFTKKNKNGVFTWSGTE